MVNQQISLCIPTYNRVQLTLDSFESVYDDERISEIIIVDDASERPFYNELKGLVENFEKVKLFRNLANRDCYFNKMTSISFATNEWCVLLDSDNKVDKSYIDKLFELEKWDKNTAYLPSFAMPTFDYRAFEGIIITKGNVASLMGEKFFSTMLNTANYFVNRNFYLKCFNGNVNPNTADSIYMNYRYLENGGKLFVVPDLYYQHLVHSQSHYILNNHKTGKFYNEVEQKLKQLT